MARTHHSWMRPLPLALALLVVVVGLALLRSPIRAVAWHPPGAPFLFDPSDPGSAWSSLELLRLEEGHGPESIVAGPDGWLYTGLKGGRIVRFRPDGSSAEPYASTGGRPNGMAFDSQGNLLVADSYEGLVAVSPDGVVRVLADQADGQPFVFPDGLDIAEDGTVWFTDATSRFPDGEFHYEVLEGTETGRLLTYDPTTHEVRTRVGNLRFPNGIALSPDGSFILVNETLGYRTLRHWIRGPKAGRTEPFVENYPGMPDDIRFNGRDRFWVALNADRMAWVDWLQPHPWLKTLLAGIVGPVFPDTDTRWIGSRALVLAIDLDGNVVRSLHDPDRRYVTSTGVLEYRGSLYVGSVVEHSVARIPLPSRSPASLAEPAQERSRRAPTSPPAVRPGVGRHGVHRRS
jgi:sugar lactone lactonase YvrE